LATTARRDTGPLAISVISIAEVVGGMRSAERREVNRLVAAMRRLPLSDPVACRAAEFVRTSRRSHVATLWLCSALGPGLVLAPDGG
jgi:predicted nucleic acid-binding protein